MTSILLKFFTGVFVAILFHRIFIGIIGVLLAFVVYKAITDPKMLGDLMAQAIDWFHSLRTPAAPTETIVSFAN